VWDSSFPSGPATGKVCNGSSSIELWPWVVTMSTATPALRPAPPTLQPSPPATSNGHCNMNKK
jgi:hypothetical protein